MSTTVHSSAIDELRHIFGDKVSVNETVRDHHSHDESFHVPVMPDAVVYVSCTEDVAAALKICNAHGTPVVPFGAGTSLEANSTPIHGGISLDL